MQSLSRKEKIRLIRDRYRKTEDLWTYMTERSKYSIIVYYQKYIALFDAQQKENNTYLHLADS